MGQPAFFLFIDEINLNFESKTLLKT